MSENKVDRETAEYDFQRFVDMMGLDLDPDTMDNDDRRDFQRERDMLVRAIERGSLVVLDSGELRYTLKAPDPVVESITFYEPTGASSMAMDRKKKDHDVAKLYAMYADITRTSPTTFAKMKQRDLRICQAVCTLFLA